MNDKIKDLKAELFDILCQQENLSNQINQLEKIKQQKLQELQTEIQNSAVTEETEKVGE